MRASRNLWRAGARAKFVRPLLANRSKPRFESPVSLALAYETRANLQEIDPVRLGSQVMGNGPPLFRPVLRRLEFPVKWRSSMAANVREHPGASSAPLPVCSPSPFRRRRTRYSMPIRCTVLGTKEHRRCDTTLRRAVLSEIRGIFRFP
jgi:hypothetical protein